MGMGMPLGRAMQGLSAEDIKGLAAEFRRALPLLCSQTAFMEGLQSVEEEELIAALRGELMDAGACITRVYIIVSIIIIEHRCVQPCVRHACA